MRSSRCASTTRRRARRSASRSASSSTTGSSSPRWRPRRGWRGPSSTTACASTSTASSTAVDAAMVKWWATELQNKIVNQGVQLHGGYGYMMEFPIAKAYLDSRISTIYGGTTEIQKEIIGRSLWFVSLRTCPPRPRRYGGHDAPPLGGGCRVEANDLMPECCRGSGAHTPSVSLWESIRSVSHDNLRPTRNSGAPVRRAESIHPHSRALLAGAVDRQRRGAPSAPGLRDRDASSISPTPRPRATARAASRSTTSSRSRLSP